MDDEEDLLSSLLAVATEELEDNPNNGEVSPVDVLSPKKTLKETDIFQFESNLNSKSLENKTNSLIHSGETDSSDDEGNRNYEDQKYNECGRDIKRLLNTNENSNSISGSQYGQPKKRVSTWNTTNSSNGTNIFNPSPAKTKAPNEAQKFQDVFLDPIFCMRIVNPKISSTMLKERMQGRLSVKFSDLARQIFTGNLKDKDWVICGVLVNKSPPKTSQKGSQYSIWTLTDLKDDFKTVALFMFSSAHKDLWKTTIGTVIGVLNPGILDKKDGCKDEATLSIDTAQKVMVFGQSKDFGICKSIKKNGEKCTAIVNLSRCECCIYHVKQEYQKCSKRSELQANFAGKGLVNLRNKVLGKNEVFYAGKSYMAIPAKKSKKLEAKDSSILQNLNGTSNNIVKAKNVTNNKKKGMARHLDVNPAQRAKDLELLKKLGGSSIECKSNFSGTRSDEISLEDSKATALSVINKLKTKQESSDSKIINKKTQYDLKGDLFVNVDGKCSFSGKMSQGVSLENSKNAALSAISKLKAKKSETESKQEDENKEPLISLEEFESELNYSDDDDADRAVPPISTVHEKLTPKSAKAVTPISLNKDKNTPKHTPKETRKTLFDSPKSQSRTTLEKLNINTPKDTPKESRKTLFDSPKSQSRTTLEKLNINTALSPKTSNARDNNGSSNFGSPMTRGESSLDKLTMGVPMLSGFGKNNLIDLSKPITSRHVDRAKTNALKYIQRNGPIKKIDPNSIKNTKKRDIHSVLDNVQSNNEDNPAKKTKLQESEFISDRFKKMMAMTSRHADLVELHDNQEKEKYFNKLEAKEKMEEKMTNTHKVKCKAVKCLKCKYTSFSASDLCKSERHPLKVFDAMKRFYKCSNCQNRTVTLELLPTRPCNNCGSSKWERTGMMKEKISVIQHNLSIRGGEQKFVNSVAADANLDLLVPDD